jgi:hypothetical protein
MAQQNIYGERHLLAMRLDISALLEQAQLAGDEPDGAKLVDVAFQHEQEVAGSRLYIILEHDSFPVTPIGQPLPEMAALEPQAEPTPEEPESAEPPAAEAAPSSEA